MKSLFFRTLLSGLLAVALPGCEQALLDDDPPATSAAIFDEMWQTVNEKYPFFAFKGVDWDSVRAVNRPRAANARNSVELFDVLAESLFVLRDGHVNLRASFDLSRNWEWYLDYPQNFNFSLVEREYLREDYRITGPLQNTWIDSVGYVYYGSFGSFVSESNVDFITARFREAKGLIIDVRDNGGGSLGNLDRLVGRLADERRLSSFRLYKTGPGREDFSDPIPRHIEPAVEEPYDRPVVVLTNRSCYSATNEFVLAMKALPNVTIVGDTTGGGGGLPFSAELPNGWRYRFSSTVSLAPDGFNVEDGIPPDVRVDLLPADEARGVDTIIETALELLR